MNAINYGKAVQYLEEWEAYAKLCLDQALARKRLKELQRIS